VAASVEVEVLELELPPPAARRWSRQYRKPSAATIAPTPIATGAGTPAIFRLDSGTLPALLAFAGGASGWVVMAQPYSG
jgi:hypothetical protein